MGRFPHYLVVVRDGETQLFEDLKTQLAREPYPAVLIWDRRRAERRTTAQRVGRERRIGERRTAPDPMLETDGFLVTVTADPPVDGIRNALASVTAPADTAPRVRRAENIFALRMFALNLETALRELRGRRTARARGRP
jgi:hypothetical protein